jgi:hypothetical protein
MVIGTVMPVIHTTAGTGHMLDGTTDGTMDGTGITQDIHTNTDGAVLDLTVELTAVGVMDIAVHAAKKVQLKQLEIAQAFFKLTKIMDLLFLF